jgi:hypothetical protein
VAALYDCMCGCCVQLLAALSRATCVDWPNASVATQGSLEQEYCCLSTVALWMVAVVLLAF